MPRRRQSTRRSFLHYEHRNEKLLPIELFVPRMLRHVGAAAVLIGVSLGLGVVGYKCFFPKLSWLDALLNASMILTGMGPVDPAETSAAKIFASLYALFSGVAFITGAGIGFTPIAHRLLHKFHLDDDSGGKPDKK
ncbi:MAG: hypothetical protein ABJC13_18440 [Acidobacteriota bacterium]